MANAEAESGGSAKLLLLWEQIEPGSPVEEPVFKHADDESRHSRLFLELARLAFAGRVHAAELEQLDRELPDVRRGPHAKSGKAIDEESLMDHLVQMNLGEIRTRVHMLMIAPVLVAMTSPDNQARVSGILTSLVRDEVRHISYTAQLMESWAADGNRARIEALYRVRLRDLHELTVQQTEAAVRSFGAGRFPELLELCFCSHLSCPIRDVGKECARPATTHQS